MLQRVVLLGIRKIFKGKYGTAEDVAKVEEMMPITSKWQVVVKETGQTVKDWDIVFVDREHESEPTSLKFRLLCCRPVIKHGPQALVCPISMLDTFQLRGIIFLPTVISHCYTLFQWVEPSFLLLSMLTSSSSDVYNIPGGGDCTAALP